MTYLSILTGWGILFVMALVSEYGSAGQATNAQLVALSVVIILNVVAIKKLAGLIIDKRARRRRDSH